MHHFEYRDGVLHAEELSIERLAAEVGTPFYCYSTATLERHFRVFRDAFSDTDSLVCYAIKSNSNIAVIKTLAELGSGMDVVSEGELRRARAAGVPGERIIFSGVGKTAEEMQYGLAEKILCFNVESEQELFLLNDVAGAMNVSAPVSMRINPDVDPKTHAKISTGKAEDKFGVPYRQARELYKQASQLNNIKITGVDMHIGSQITDLQPFGDAFQLLRDLVIELRGDGHNIDHIDLGGGLGIPYGNQENPVPLPDDYAAVVKTHTKDLGCRLLFEPGRMITGNSGILVTRVLFVKNAIDKSFTIVDAAMNDLIRPTLYEAYHDIIPVSDTRNSSPQQKTDIVGPVCETGDYLALDRSLPAFEQGDLLSVMTAGAYGATLSSQYNSRRLIPEILVKKDEYCVIRPRESYEDMLSREKIPSWFSET